MFLYHESGCNSHTAGLLNQWCGFHEVSHPTSELSIGCVKATTRDVSVARSECVIARMHTPMFRVMHEAWLILGHVKLTHAV